MNLQGYERPRRITLHHGLMVQTVGEGSSFPFSRELLKVYFQP